jgi:hypothetical protein
LRTLFPLKIPPTGYPLVIMKAPRSPYEELLHLTHTYLGWDAAAHIAKLINIHLDKSPEELTKEELTSLLEWISMAVTFIVEDQATIKRYLARLSKYAQAEEAN